MGKHDDVIVLVARYAAAGRLDPQRALSAIKELAGSDRAPSAPAVLDALERLDLPAATAIRTEVQKEIYRIAFECHEHRAAGARLDSPFWPELPHLPLPPLGWRDERRLLNAARRLMDLCRARTFVRNLPVPLPAFSDQLAILHAEAMAAFESQPGRWTHLLPAGELLPESLRTAVAEAARRAQIRAADALDAAPRPPDGEIDEAAYFNQLVTRFFGSGENRTWQRALLDQALCWPTDALAEVLPSLCTERWARERAVAVLVKRFGRIRSDDWDAWEDWLGRQVEERARRVAELRTMVQEYSDELAGVWCEENPDAKKPGAAEELASRSRRRTAAADIEAFIAAWRTLLAPMEVEVLRALREVPALETAPAPPEPAEAVPAKIEKPVGEETPPPVAVERLPSERRAAPAIPEMSGWRDQVQAFLTENWYIAAGLAMAVVGASLLAYFTWDRHWVLRYTIMPSLLALFTLALPHLAGRIERRFESLRATALLLRGAAIGLLPVNFMAVGLLARDGEVTHKALSVPVMAAAYLLVFGVSLFGWCRAVNRRIAAVTALSVLGLNALLFLLPAAALAPWYGEASTHVVSAIGFHAGFALTAFSALWFVRRALTPEMLGDRVVPWFFALALGGTFAEVFAWGHWMFGEAPRPEVCSIMAILAGGVVVFTERRVANLVAAEPRYVGASFFGYALVLFGILLGMGSPWVRIAALVLGGIVWLFQASLRSGGVHFAIGLALVMLGAAAVALLPQFPKGEGLNLLPALGLGVALAFRTAQGVAEIAGRGRLAQAFNSFLPGVFAVTAVASVLSQWHYRSEPWHVGAVLACAAAYFAFRAGREGSSVWVYTTMAVLSLVPVYFGCVDMRAHALYGNNLVFGLAVLMLLWLATLSVRPANPWIRERSTVALCLAVLSFVAMLLRVFVEQGQDQEGSGIRCALDIAGPLMLSVGLAFVTYHSRSLLPAALAAAVVVVLLPELKESIRMVFPAAKWGSGLGSSLSGVVLALLVFPLRQWKRLADLGPGDRSFRGGDFPFLRPDHTLFTWPILASALFLTVKVDTWNLARNFLGAGVGVKTAVALGITAIAWQALAAAFRKDAFSRAAAVLTFVELVLCFRFLNPRLLAEPQGQYPFLFAGAAMSALAAAYAGMATRAPWVGDALYRPAAAILREGSWIGAGAVAVLLFGGEAFSGLCWFGAFILLHLFFFGLKERAYHFGVFAFLLAGSGILAGVSPGEGDLLSRLTFSRSMTPMLVFALAIQILHVAVEWVPGLFDRTKPLLKPFLWGSVAVAAATAVLAFGQFLGAPALEMTPLQQVSTVALVALAARALASAEAALVAAALGYLVVQAGELGGLAPGAPRIELFVTPWRLAVFGLLLASVPYLGRLARRLIPSLTASRQPLAVSPIRADHPFFWAAITATLVSVVHFMGVRELRHEAVQLPAPYLAAATSLAVALIWRHTALFAAGSLALSLGNIRAVDISVGETLLSWGLSHFHIVCLGFIATLLQATALRIFVRAEAAARRITQGCLVAAGLVLALLSIHYFAHPNLESMSLQRFALSGAMAIVAGLYFRRAARAERDGLAASRTLLEGIYHYSIAMAIWCAALMVPALRHPATALAAIGLPPLYFYLRAEIGARGGAVPRYRDSSAILCGLVLALYAFKGIFHIVLFPGVPVDTNHYHVNAPVALATGLVLLRLRSFGAPFAVAAFGGLAVAVAVFFGVTAFPGLSPFDHPVPAAWAAVALGHLFSFAVSRQSPLGALAQRAGGIGEMEWQNLRAVWGNAWLFGALVATAFGLLDAWQGDTPMVAPLLAGAASLFFHQAVRGATWPCHLAGAVLTAIALHADFLVPSFLDRDYVGAVIIGLWMAFAAIDGFLCRFLDRPVLFAISAAFLSGTLAHAFYHRPWSIGGLCALALAGLLWALSVRDDREPSGEFDLPASASLLVWPPALIYFGQVYGLARGARGILDTWPVLCGLAAWLGVAWLARLSQTAWAAELARVRGATTRLFDHTLFLLARHGGRVHASLVFFVLAAAAALLEVHYDRPYSHAEVAVFALVWIGLAAAWAVRGREQSSAVSILAAEICVLGLCLLARRQLVLTTDWWNPRYDVWASLAVSAGLTGAKGWLDDQDRSLKLPLLNTMYALPLIAVGWTMLHDLGSNVVLVVVGLHSVLYAYLGRAGREPRYDVAATFGFTAFVLIMFWSKLELRVAQAYVIPVGVGLLTLVQILGNGVPPATRSLVRALVLLAMLGSAGYYALLDGSYPVAFNAVLLGVGLAAMLVGTLLKVKLYLALGFAGIVVDLASIFYKTVVLMETAYRMTIIGVLLLLAGAAVVGGSILFKTRADAAEAWLRRVRERLSVWD